MTDKEMEKVQDIADELANAGMMLSFVYGRSEGLGIIWSVDVLNKNEDHFEKPYVARSLTHAAEIARLESVKRGGLKP